MSLKILIAEDDIIMREALAAVLEAEGFFPIIAANGNEALTLFEQEHPLLVCLDIMMPKIDGFEVCRRIRARNKNVPILFLSAKNQEIDVLAGFRLGADDFIRKPFTRSEVVARIHAVLRRSHAPEKFRLSFSMHDLKVWPEELRAERGGREIELTPREVSMLTLLFEYAGSPVTRDIFLDRCWGIDYFPDSRTLDQHIATLRRKVEIPEGSEVIETVRGVGYRFRKLPLKDGA